MNKEVYLVGSELTEIIELANDIVDDGETGTEFVNEMLPRLDMILLQASDLLSRYGKKPYCTSTMAACSSILIDHENSKARNNAAREDKPYAIRRDITLKLAHLYSGMPDLADGDRMNLDITIRAIELLEQWLALLEGVRDRVLCCDYLATDADILVRLVGKITSEFADENEGGVSAFLKNNCGIEDIALFDELIAYIRGNSIVIGRPKGTLEALCGGIGAYIKIAGEFQYGEMARICRMIQNAMAGTQNFGNSLSLDDTSTLN